MWQPLVRLEHKVHGDGWGILPHASLLEREEEAVLILPKRDRPQHLFLRHVSAAAAVGAIADAYDLPADGWLAEGDEVDGRGVAVVIVDGVDDGRGRKKGQVGRKLDADHSVVDKLVDVQAHVEAD